MVSCVELAAVQDKPALWSTALMWLVAELFEALPEAGDLPKPKLVVFLDEAHLLFDDATDAFLDALARTVRLIRSKGVGVFFVTQQPTDVSEEVLAQLGLRIQHALRAFTPSDAKKLQRRSSTYPRSDLYDVEDAADLGRHRRGGGHAAVGEGRADAGRPHPDARPASSMDPAAGSTPRRRGRRCGRSTARATTPRARARSSPAGSAPPAPAPDPVDAPMEHVPLPRRAPEPKRAPAPKGGGADAIGDFLNSRQGKTLQRDIVRGIFGMLRKKI